MASPALSPEAFRALLIAALSVPVQPADQQKKPPQDTGVEPVAYDVHEFCRAHRISRATFFALRADDRAREEELKRPLLPSERKAPRCKAIGHKLIISREAACEWRNG